MRERAFLQPERRALYGEFVYTIIVIGDAIHLGSGKGESKRAETQCFV
jgi:hypothetical protein